MIYTIIAQDSNDNQIEFDIEVDDILTKEEVLRRAQLYARSFMPDDLFLVEIKT